jgi:hypothetical protein
LKFFLLVYERSTGRLLEQRTYSEEEQVQAQDDRFARELQERGRPDIEVVLLGAESLDALKKTHGRYFKTVRELLEELKANSPAGMA